ncbi:short-chain fatty acid transporter [Psychrilyobacter sp.]|uniref:short-chain fatty acid transporter n=1 Tax=Psychrilyobacter sp. TaxID=2586924 RepID=UPI00301B2990
MNKTAVNETGSKQKNIFEKFTNFCVILIQKYLPDPFIFCAILTFIVFLIAIPITKQSPMSIINDWTNGFWSLLSFAMQMALVLVTGHTMANSPFFKRTLSSMAGKLKNPSQAIIGVTVVSVLASFINWGFGLVIGAIFAKEIAKKVKGVDYRLLIASAYTGFLVWHGGLSASIPLKLASGDGLESATAGAVTAAIPTSMTIFSSTNLIILAILFVTLPFVNRAMHPKKDDVITIDNDLLIEIPEEKINFATMTPAEKIENNKVISLFLGIMGYTYIISYFMKNGFVLNLNIVNFVFLFTAIILHGTPRKFLNAIKEATTGASGIILQFPFYAGIMGIMVGQGAHGVSIAGAMSQMFVNISTETTFPFFAFLSAGLVNFFVPSGGGQWAVQAPIMMPAGAALGIPAAKTAMAIAWGDAWTNMIQPFWALPALAIAGLGAKDIMGYCLVVLIYSGVIISLVLMFL